MDLQLQGKRVLITGSAKGIGRETASLFLEEGAEVIINGRRQKEVSATVKDLSEKGTCYGFAADLTSPEEVKYLTRKIAEIGELNILVNNAGFFSMADFFHLNDDDWLHYWETNIMSAVRLMRHYLPRMLERDEGRIINISSEAAVKPDEEMLPYAVTKSGMMTLARGAAELTKGTNVTVNSVLPGPTWSEGVEQFAKSGAEEQGIALETFIRNFFRENEPTSLIQRFAEMEEVAAAIVFIASPKASAINGASQRVEGGIYQSI